MAQSQFLQPLSNPGDDLQSRVGLELKFGERTVRLIHVLGSGSYGAVYLATDSVDQIHYAVKYLKWYINDDPRFKIRIPREVQLHCEVSGHENIVSLLGSTQGLDGYYILLEYCSGGDLFQHIKKGLFIRDDAFIRTRFLQILDAVKHCHDRGIYHRDLKLENIFVTGSEQLKLGDFGSATVGNLCKEDPCGPNIMLSPECSDTMSVRTSGIWPPPNDVWSLGIILVELVCGLHPLKYTPLESYRDFCRGVSRIRAVLQTSNEVHAILFDVFQEIPERRPDVRQLRKMIEECDKFFPAQASEAIIRA